MLFGDPSDALGADSEAPRGGVEGGRLDADDSGEGAVGELGVRGAGFDVAVDDEFGVVSLAVPSPL